MRIALLTDGIWPYRIGGMQKHSYYLVKYLARNGVEVDLYHLNQSSYDISKLEFFSEEEKKFIRSFVFTFPNKGRWPWHYLSESKAYSKMMYEQFRKQPPVDLIYTKGYTGWYFLQQKEKGEKLPPVAIRLHGYEIFQPSVKNFRNRYWNMLYRPLVNYLNEKADYIYSYGGGVTDLIRKNIPGSEKKVIEIPAGIEPEWIFEGNKKIHQPLHFAFLGRYDIRKGVLELSKALQNLAGKTSFEFHFIGPVPEELKLNSPQIRYHGEIREAEKIKSILRDADVFVLPSHSEGMPNVILEAMASGCAVLATRVGAVDVMVDESNGWLIPPMDAKSIEEKMQHILGMEPAAIEKKKMRSVEKIKHQFLWDEVVKLEMQAIKKISGS